MKSVNERMTSQSLIDQNVTVDDGHFYDQSSGDELTISQHNVQNQKFKSISTIDKKRKQDLILAMGNPSAADKKQTSLVLNYYRDERRQQKLFKQSLEKAAANAAKRPQRSGTPGLVAGPASAVQNIFNMPGSGKRTGSGLGQGGCGAAA